MHLQSLKLLRGDAFYKKVHYLPVTLGCDTKYCPIPSTSYDLCTCKVLSCYIQQFRRIIHLQENTVFDVDLWVEVTQNVAQYPLHHVTYALAKFEVATSNSLGGDPLQENTLFDL